MTRHDKPRYIQLVPTQPGCRALFVEDRARLVTTPVVAWGQPADDGSSPVALVCHSEGWLSDVNEETNFVCVLHAHQRVDHFRAEVARVVFGKAGKDALPALAATGLPVDDYFVPDAATIFPPPYDPATPAPSV